MGHIDEKAQRGRGSIRKAPILAMASYSNIPRHKQKKRRSKTYRSFSKWFSQKSLQKNRSTTWHSNTSNCAAESKPMVIEFTMI